MIGAAAWSAAASSAAASSAARSTVTTSRAETNARAVVKASPVGLFFIFSSHRALTIQDGAILLDVKTFQPKSLFSAILAWVYRVGGNYGVVRHGAINLIMAQYFAFWRESPNCGVIHGESGAIFPVLAQFCTDSTKLPKTSQVLFGLFSVEISRHIKKYRAISGR